MRFLIAAMVAFSLIQLSACAPFSSGHELVDIEEGQRNRSFQAYYVPKTVLTLVIKEQSNKNRIIELSTQKIPDQDYLFKVNYNRSIVHKDDLAITTTSEGYLEKVRAHTVDESALIVAEAAKIFKRLRGATTKKVPGVKILKVQFDPFQPSELASGNRLLRAEDFCVNVYDKHNELLPGSCTNGRNKWNGSAEASHSVESERPTEAEGFFYRRPIKHRVIIFKRNGKGWSPVEATLESFENQASFLEVIVDRGAFNSLQAEATFENGALKKYSILEDKSEMLGFMAIPLTVVNAVFSLNEGGTPGDSGGSANQAKKEAQAQKQATENLKSLTLAETGHLGNRTFYGDPTVGRSNRALSPVQIQNEKIRFLSQCQDQPDLDAEECKAFWRNRNSF